MIPTRLRWRRGGALRPDERPTQPDPPADEVAEAGGLGAALGLPPVEGRVVDRPAAQHQVRTETRDLVPGVAAALDAAERHIDAAEVEIAGIGAALAAAAGRVVAEPPPAEPARTETAPPPDGCLPVTMTAAEFGRQNQGRRVVLPPAGPAVPAGFDAPLGGLAFRR